MISLIVAMARNRVIGYKGSMPWHMPADLAHFKRITMGKPIVMGHTTFKSIGRPLPGRANIVLTRHPHGVIAGVQVVQNLDQAWAAAPLQQEVMVIGGAQVYRQTLHQAQRIYRTLIDCAPEGDCLFPELSNEWHVVASRAHPADEHNPYACVFETLEKGP